MMKKRFVLILALCALLLLCGCMSEEEMDAYLAEDAQTAEAAEATPAQDEAAPAQDEVAPQSAATGAYSGITFSATALDGRSIDETYIRNHDITVVNFWATWCPPCVAEIPEFSEVASDYASKNVAFLGVQLDDDTAAAKEMWEKTGVVYPSVLATGDLATLSNQFEYIPVTVIFGSDGMVIGEPHVGGMDQATLMSIIDGVL